MKRTSLIRWGGLAAMVGGVAFVVESLLILVGRGHWTSVVHNVAVLLILAGMVGLHTLQKENYGQIGTSGFYTVIVALLTEVLAVITFWLHDECVSFPGFTLAYILAYFVTYIAISVGFVLYGAATLQAKVLPRWCGLGLIIIPPLTQIFLGDSAAILFGLLWVALGYVLWSRRDTVAQQPSRVR